MEERHDRVMSFFILIGLILLSIFLQNSKSSELLWGASIGAAISFITIIGNWFLINRKQIRTILCSQFIWNLRISCSYLYRISLEDSYLLIKSRKHGKFQPVGGNFKRNKFSHETLQNLEVRDDYKFSNCGRSKDDLRLYIRGYKLPQFLKWYNSPNKKREVSYDREFYEELIEPGFFSSEIFKYPIINFIKQIVTPVRYSQFLNCYEVHIYDIVELTPTRKQKKFLEELRSKGDHENFIWVDARTIRNQGYQEQTTSSPYNITDHSKEILK